MLIRGRAGRVVAGVVLAALTAAGVLPAGAESPPEGHPRSVDVPDGIVRLLSDRAESYVEGDRERFARTLAEGSFRASELEHFDAADAVPITAYRLRAVVRSGDLTSTRVRRAYPDREVLLLHVRGETVLGGVEDEAFVHSEFATFARDEADPEDRYAGWRLVSRSDLEPLGLFSRPQPWETGPVDTARSEHFLLIGPPDVMEDLGAVLEIAEQAYTRVRELWPRPPDGGFVIVVPATIEDLEEQLGTTMDLTRFVAFAAGSVDREGGWRPRGVRLYLNLQNFRRHSEASQEVTLAHELVHAVTHPVSGPFVPSWVEEGLAMFASEQSDGLAVARQGPPPEDFPADEVFVLGTVQEIVRIYRRAQVAIDTLARHHGTQEVIAFYEALGQRRVEPGTDTYHVRRVVEDTVGWTLEDWREAWLERLR